MTMPKADYRERGMIGWDLDSKGTILYCTCSRLSEKSIWWFHLWINGDLPVPIDIDREKAKDILKTLDLSNRQKEKEE